MCDIKKSSLVAENSNANQIESIDEVTEEDENDDEGVDEVEEDEEEECINWEQEQINSI